MRIAILLLLVACGAAPVRPRTCPDAWVVVRARRNCVDIRGGISGFWVFEIVDGAHRGAMVVGQYSDPPKERGIGYGGSNWGIARVHFSETTGATGWDNGCILYGPSTIYAGSVETYEGFDEESAARRAWTAKPCEGKLAMPEPSPSCEGKGWVLMRAAYQCSDIRSGFSGYWLLEVIGGPHAGKTVVARYGEGAVAQVGTWNLSRDVTFAPVSPHDPAMDNSCTQSVVAPDKPATYDGSVDTREATALYSYETEAAGRAALTRRCKL